MSRWPAVPSSTATILLVPPARASVSSDAMPLSTRLTPDMIDFFGLDPAFERPSMAALVACSALPACGDSDSSRVRFVDATGHAVPAYDGTATTTAERMRVQRTTPAAGVGETRTVVRRYATDEQGRLVMNGSDSIVKINSGAPGRAPSTRARTAEAEPQTAARAWWSTGERVRDAGAAYPRRQVIAARRLASSAIGWEDRNIESPAMLAADACTTRRSNQRRRFRLPTGASCADS